MWTYETVMLTLITASTVQSEHLTIEHDPQRKVTWTGNDVTLTGIEQSDPVLSGGYQSSWTKDNHSLQFTESRYRLEPQGLKLHIQTVRLEDAGDYQFRIIYKLGDDFTLREEITTTELVVIDDGDLCPDQKLMCQGYCIPKEQTCAVGNSSLGVVIGAVVGSFLVFLIILACALLFLLSRNGHGLCDRRLETSLAERTLCEDTGNGDDDISIGNGRNGAIVSFAASPTVQIYERIEDCASDSDSCTEDVRHNRKNSNETLQCETTTV